MTRLVSVLQTLEGLEVTVSRPKTLTFTFTALLAGLAAFDCQRAYYHAYYQFWEQLGREKRDLLVSELSKTGKDEEGLKKEFTDTLQRIRTEYKFDGGELEKTYDSLSGDYETAKAKSDRLHERIDKVRVIAHDLFREWESEAKQIDDAPLRNSSLSNLEQSKAQFAATDEHLAQVEKKLAPVLKKLNNHVLYLKHALNARAVGSLQTELKAMGPEIEDLLRSLAASINSAKSFENKIAKQKG